MAAIASSQRWSAPPRGRSPRALVRIMAEAVQPEGQSREVQDDHREAAELEGSRMPFLAHLRELRDRVRKAAIYFGLAFGVCFYFAKDIYAWLKVPLFNAWRANPALLKESPSPHV